MWRWSRFIVFTVNDLVTKYKLKMAGSAKRRHFSDVGLDAITAASDESKRRDTERDLRCLDGLFCWRYREKGGGQSSAIVGMLQLLHVVCMSDLKLIECKLPVGVVTPFAVRLRLASFSVHLWVWLARKLPPLLLVADLDQALPKQNHPLDGFAVHQSMVMFVFKVVSVHSLQLGVGVNHHILMDLFFKSQRGKDKVQSDYGHWDRNKVSECCVCVCVCVCVFVWASKWVSEQVSKREREREDACL